MFLSRIQEQIGVRPDNRFGKDTALAIMEYLKITPLQAAHFLGQCGHETGGWSVFVENLNYSAQGLLRTFPRHFNEVQAREYERQPERIANLVYANRMGNGNEQSGDGWRFRGRGSIQLTGRSNYTAFSRVVNDPQVVLEPDKILDTYLLESAKWFFDRNGIWRFCIDASDASVLRVSRFVNLGNPNSTATPHGLQDRINRTRQALAFLT